MRLKVKVVGLGSQFATRSVGRRSSVEDSFPVGQCAVYRPVSDEQSNVVPGAVVEATADAELTIHRRHVQRHTSVAQQQLHATKRT